MYTQVAGSEEDLRKLIEQLSYFGIYALTNRSFLLKTYNRTGYWIWTPP